MIDFIPLSNYLEYYNIVIFMFLCFYLSHSFFHTEFYNTRNNNIFILTVSFIAFIYIYTGFRPVSFAFGDMGNYNRYYQELSHGLVFDNKSDVVFYSTLYLFSQYLPAECFFIFCYSIYFFCIVIALKRLFGSSWIWYLISIVILFSFWQYGVNGIRNGMATSVFLLALSFKGYFKWILMILAFGLHSSLLLPIVAYFLAVNYKKTNGFLLGWCVCLLVSILTPSIGDYISAFGVLDDKITAYANSDDITIGTKKFRWDFLLFSIMPIIIGFYYMIKNKQQDDIYHIIFSIYLTCNAFWLLVIRYPVSNRFAYLSWFLYGIVLAYPFFNGYLMRYQNRYFSCILLFLFFLSLYIV